MRLLQKNSFDFIEFMLRVSPARELGRCQSRGAAVTQVGSSRTLNLSIGLQSCFGRDGDAPTFPDRRP
jgi:hypothetical protein